MAKDNSSDKITSLQKHLETLNNRLQSKQVGSKNASRPEAYFEWVKREMERTQNKINKLKS